jgi:hypothetical protein
LGGAVANYVIKASGMGAYRFRIASNSLWKDGVPVFNGNSDLRMRRREFLFDLSGSIAFTKTEIRVNPGLSEYMPVGSKVAQIHQQYRQHGALLEFLSKSANALNSTNTALGTVIIAFQANPYAAAFTTKQEMESTEYCVSVKPCDSAVFPIECDPKQNTLSELFVRDSDVIDGDERFYDMGVITIATVGMQAAAVIGEIWISYDVALMKPLLEPASYGDNNGAHVANGGYDANNTLGIVQRTVYGKLKFTITTTGAGLDSISLPVSVTTGYFLIFVCWIGTPVTTTIPTTTFTNCALGPNWATSDTVTFINNTGISQAKLFVIMSITVSASGAKVQFSGGTLPSSGTSVTIAVVQVDSSFFSAVAMQQAIFEMMQAEEFAREQEIKETYDGFVNQFSYEDDEKSVSNTCARMTEMQCKRGCRH